MTRRILAIALSCTALYAVVLGAGANAQDPTPSATATTEATSEPTSTATPFASPVETVLSDATPEPTPEQTSTPDATSTPEQTSTPSSTPSSTPESTPTASPTGTPTATPESQQGERKSAPTKRDVDLVDLVAEACEDGKLTKKERELLVEEGLTSARGSGKVCEEAKREAKKQKGKKDRKRAKGKKGDKHGHGGTVAHRKETRHADGSPTLDNPTFAQADPGAAAIGVPNFFIDKFRIPPFLLSIYQAAGMEYGVRWEILAAINEIETDYGRNLNVSSAGALGWMQFMPATWAAYGVDANRDGLKDPYNPVDAIFAAARYLRAAGADTDIRKAVFAYNHADWYVDSVLLRARVIGGLPSNFVGSLTGLTQARFPVWAKATYAGEVDAEAAAKRTSTGNAANVVEAAEARRGIRIFARSGAPVIAVNDGKVLRTGVTERLGRFVQIQDVYGNVFTYGHLASIPETVPFPKQRDVAEEKVIRELKLPKADPKPSSAASTTAKRASKVAKVVKPAARKRAAALPAPRPAKDRLFANPRRANAYKAGGERQLAGKQRRAEKFARIAGGPLKVTSKDFVAKPLRKGTRIVAGTILGRIGKTDAAQAPHVLFEIRPAGRGAPRIDPKPILDGWKLLESTAIYRAKGKNPFFGDGAKQPSIGQILLMSKEHLARRVLRNPRVDVYGCGRQDVQAGAIDRRVLATLEFLAASGLRPTVTSLKCGHGFYTSSGNVSHHSSGNAVDIAAVNGIPMTGNQGRGSITDITIQRLLTLQGTLKPDQIISLMTYENADNTYAMADHHDHIHIGWRPLFGTNSKAAKQVNAVLKPDQWIKLIDRLNALDNPTVRLEPSKYSVKVTKHASHAHRGE